MASASSSVIGETVHPLIYCIIPDVAVLNN